MCELILASKSPRRHELLKLLGHPFKIMVSKVEEDRADGENPSQHVIRLSELKAREVGSRIGSGIVIGADTIVVLENEILGKPLGPDDAVEMLMRLQGRTHRVFTGFALYDSANGRIMSDYETTEVTMREMTEDHAWQYVQTGEPLDKAGSYGIQGFGATLVTSIRGCYFNVMGLPLAKLMESLYIFTDGLYGYFGTGK